MKIKVLEKTPGCFPCEFKIGDWHDLVTAEDITIRTPYAKTLHRNVNGDITERTRDVIFTSKMIPLGVCIQMPKGFEGYLVPRSSTFKKFGILQTNSIGIIDETFNSDEDEWKMPVVALRPVTIPKGTRIAQFRIQLSQKATFWQKLKWLLSSKPKLVKVSSLDNPKRGGFGEGTDK